MLTKRTPTVKRTMHPSEHIPLLSHLIERARAHGADQADTILLSSAELSVSVRMRRPEHLERSESTGVGLRVWVGDRLASVSSTSLRHADLDMLAERAVATARASLPDADTTLAEDALLCRAVRDLDLIDPAEPTPETLFSWCQEAENAALDVTGISNSEGADASYSRTGIALMTSPRNGDGFTGQYTVSHLSLSLSVLAGAGTGMERDYAYSSTRHIKDLQPAATLGREAAEKALKRLHPRKVETAQIPVIFDPRVARTLLSALAGAISGASVVRGTTFLKDRLNTTLFAPSITITDDPLLPRALGSRPFDAEGVAPSRIDIVEDGRLARWLLDTRSARKLGLRSSGNAARGLGASPQPSSSNLYMHAGPQTPQELIADIQRGFYVTDTFGMGVNTITGDYSQGAAGFWIERGEIAYPVSEVTIAGHLSDMFARATPANDLLFRYAVNAPTVRIDGMTVAGR